jgi:predicted site-specific integrase-resolvase
VALWRTLQRWDRDGRLKPERTPSARRAYSKTMQDSFMRRDPPQGARKAVTYCRVSSAAQKPDLKNQRRVLEDFCAARGFDRLSASVSTCTERNHVPPENDTTAPMILSPFRTGKASAGRADSR